MSSFVVDDNTYLAVWDKLEDLRSEKKALAYGGFYLYSAKALEKDINDLRKLNVDQTNYRYKSSDHVDDVPELPKLKFSDARHKGSDMSPIQLLASLRCIRYQCMEAISELPEKLAKIYADVSEYVIDAYLEKELRLTDWG